MMSFAQLLGKLLDSQSQAGCLGYFQQVVRWLVVLVERSPQQKLHRWLQLY
jgi:hypothetical protein